MRNLRIYPIAAVIHRIPVLSNSYEMENLRGLDETCGLRPGFNRLKMPVAVMAYYDVFSVKTGDELLQSGKQSDVNTHRPILFLFNKPPDFSLLIIESGSTGVSENPKNRIRTERFTALRPLRKQAAFEFHDPESFIRRKTVLEI